MRSHFLLFACASAMASSAVADTKVAGSFDCDKPQLTYTIPVPDVEPGQTFVLEQRKCRWTKPWTIAGAATTENTNVTFVEVTGPNASFINVSVTTYANGDKTFVHSVDKSVPGGSTGKWTYTGGTGKLQGIKGQGISKCKAKSPEPGAEYTCDLTGSYKIVSPRKKT